MNNKKGIHMEEKSGKEKEKVTIKKAENFSEWYTQVVIKSDFIDYTSVSGCMAFRPDSYFVWEMIQKGTDDLLKKEGIQNVYFPLLIPEKLLQKEKEHVEGFSPEVAWVTYTGESKLDERLAVRPTSETIMYDSFSKWIRSWRDLPMRYNQWNSVIRWEFKHPTPLLRTREFLWNEGHTVFATKEEADKEKDAILGIYQKILEEYLALAGILGRKTETEKFAGAVMSTSIEHLLPDGIAIQGPAFHNDEQNFSKAFDIKFLDKEGKQKYAYQNTFAISTREMGVMVAVHGDDKGLVIPPMLSRIQVVIVPIYRDENAAMVLKEAKALYNKIKDKFRTYIDDRDAYSPGWKFNEWELKGVPLRIEIGERDIKSKSVVAVRRDTGKKQEVKVVELEESITMLLKDIQKSMYKKSKELLENNTHIVKNYNELKDVIKKKGGFVQAAWCGSENCEAKVKKETTAKATNMPVDKQKEAKGKKCAICGEDAKFIVNFAKSY
jgi:prolyl-tRNA synthetase